MPLGTQEATEQGVQRAALFVQTPQGCERALTGLTVFVAKRLHQAHIAVPAGRCDLEEHVPSVAQSWMRTNYIAPIYWHYRKIKN